MQGPALDRLTRHVHVRSCIQVISDKTIGSRELGGCFVQAGSPDVPENAGRALRIPAELANFPAHPKTLIIPTIAAWDMGYYVDATANPANANCVVKLTAHRAQLVAKKHIGEGAELRLSAKFAANDVYDDTEAD